MFTRRLLIAIASYASFTIGARSEVPTEPTMMLAARRFVATTRQMEPSDIILSEVTRRRGKPTRSGVIDAVDDATIVYNIEPRGFVVVTSAGDTARVTGYSAHTTFDPVSTPPALAAWLEWLDATAPQASSQRSAASTSVVAPLLDGVAWDQWWPWNALCPQGAPAGCMATAMAQVMYYHRYPSQGTGIHSYTTDGQTLTVNFAQQAYDYSQMFGTYTTSLPTASLNEVARLTYHAGVALDMQYSADASSSFVGTYARALTENFGYSTTVSCLTRDVFEADEWDALLRYELEAGRPVLYGGQSRSGGHAFVVDGVGDNGLYHINWGWRGLYDGYYDIAVLNPEGSGTGSAAADGGYNSDQTAVVGISPRGDDCRYYNSIRAEEIRTSTPATTRGGQANINFRGSLVKYAFPTQRGRITASIRRNGVIVAESTVGPAVFQAYRNGLGIAQVDGMFTVPSDLADGDYQVYATFMPYDASGTDIIRCVTSGGPRYLDMHVEGDIVTLHHATPIQRSDSAAFILTSTPTVTAGLQTDGTCALGRELTVSATVQNVGRDYNGTFYVDLYPTASMSGTPLLTLHGEAIVGAGETCVVSATGTLTGLSARRIYYAAISYMHDGTKVRPSGSGITNSLMIRVAEADATGIASPHVAYPTSTTRRTYLKPWLYVEGGRKVMQRPDVR